MSDPDDEVLIETLRERLEEWNMGLDELQATVDRAEAEENARLKTRLQILRGDFQRAEERFQKLSLEGGGRWDELREGMEEGRRLLDEALEEARPEPR